MSKQPTPPLSAGANAVSPPGDDEADKKRSWWWAPGTLIATGAGLFALAGSDRAPKTFVVPMPSASTVVGGAIPADTVGERPSSDDGRDANEPQPPVASSSVPVTASGPCIPQAAVAQVELAEILYRGYLDYFGHPPTANRLACAWAHCAFEHARGVKLFGNNLGHITTAGAWSGATCTQAFTRRVGTSPDRWEASSLTFRVHATLHDGAVDYWRLLHVQYPGVLSHCDRGDAVEAARELRRRNYFTGPAEPYVRSVARLYLEGLGNVLPKLEHPVWPLEGARRPGRSAQRR